MKIENIQIRRMHVRDLTGVVQIEGQAFAMPWTPQMFLNEIAAGGESVPLVAYLGGRLVGYAILWLVGIRLHLANIAVDEGCRRLGIGTILVRRAFVEAGIRRCRRVSLETRASNRVAIDLFRRLGFRTMAVSQGYYTDNDEDALVMVRAIEVTEKSDDSIRAAEGERNVRTLE